MQAGRLQGGGACSATLTAMQTAQYTSTNIQDDMRMDMASEP